MSERGRRLLERHGALVVFFVVACALWLAGAPYRHLYQPDFIDVPTLVDGSLLRPGARWTEWFTRGYRDFWQAYPEWPNHETDFARPLFSFAVYLVSLAAGRDWPFFLVINVASVAAVAALTFALARRALEMSVAWSLAAVAFVLLSPPVHQYTLGSVGFASEPMATAFVAAALLALLDERDGVATLMLILALLTKETAVWAPVAAAVTVFVRAGDASRGRRAARAAVVLAVPIGLWLVLRFSLHEGLGGTYATTGWRSVAHALRMVPRGLRHAPEAFVSTQAFTKSAGPGLQLLDRRLGLLCRIAVSALFGWWLLSTLGELRRGGAATLARPSMLLALWACGAMAFRLLLPLSFERYHVTLVMLLWPLLLHRIMRRRSRLLVSALAVLAIALLPRVGLAVLPVTLRPDTNEPLLATRQSAQRFERATAHLPAGAERVYLIGGAAPLGVNPEILAAFFETPVPIVRLVDIAWSCAPRERKLELRRDVDGAWVTLAADLGPCGKFAFSEAGLPGAALAAGGLARNDLIKYDLPDARVVERPRILRAGIDPGRRLTIRIATTARGYLLVDDPRSEDFVGLEIP